MHRAELEAPNKQPLDTAGDAAQRRADDDECALVLSKERSQDLFELVGGPVSYTHLTLPTIYSV